MFTHAGGQKVGSGTYWNVKTGLRVDVDQVGTLPGGIGAMYVKASSSVVLLSGPILGLAYIVFLPIMGIMTALSCLLRKTVGGVSSLGRSVISFGWRPAEAYLGGKNKKKDDSDKAGSPPIEK